jgi:pimeloyl-ACP methyl ester carboxylesterase
VKPEELGFVEKQVTAPSGGVINYGEGPAEGIPLMLIPGQWLDWRDYRRTFEKLITTYHVYAVDCYGHGNSSKNPDLYPAVVNGADLCWFVDEVIGQPTVVAGHSSGGMIAAYVAAMSDPDLIEGVIFEDPPLLSLTPALRGKTVGWARNLGVMAAFLEQDEETSYIHYWLDHTYLRSYWGDDPHTWETTVKAPALRALERHPDRPPRLSGLNAVLNKALQVTACSNDGTGTYDLRYAASLVDYSWNEGYDDLELLSRISCPALLFHDHVTYDANGIMQGAMPDDATATVKQILPDLVVLDDLTYGHDIHDNAPDFYADQVLAFSERLNPA